MSATRFPPGSPAHPVTARRAATAAAARGARTPDPFHRQAGLEIRLLAGARLFLLWEKGPALLAEAADGRPTTRRGWRGSARWAGSGPTRRHADLVAPRVAPGVAVVHWSVPQAATRAVMAWRRSARQLPPMRHRHPRGSPLDRWGRLDQWGRPPATAAGRTIRVAPQSSAFPARRAVVRWEPMVGPEPARTRTRRERHGGVPPAACAALAPRPGRRQPGAQRLQRRTAQWAAPGPHGECGRGPGGSRSGKQR